MPRNRSKATCKTLQCFWGFVTSCPGIVSSASKWLSRGADYHKSFYKILIVTMSKLHYKYVSDLQYLLSISWMDSSENSRKFRLDCHSSRLAHSSHPNGHNSSGYCVARELNNLQLPSRIYQVSKFSLLDVRCSATKNWGNAIYPSPTCRTCAPEVIACMTFLHLN